MAKGLVLEIDRNVHRPPIDLLADLLIGFDSSRTWADEHDRADLYHQAFDRPEAYEKLWQAASEEPEPSIKSWVVVQMIERADPDETERWLELYPGQYARRRVAEMAIFRSLSEGSDIDPLQIDEWSDWLQRRVSSQVSRRDVLSVLAAKGRTKRVRATATSVLQSLDR